MATVTDKRRCVVCNKEKVTFKCEGCFNDYCYKHLGDHRQELSEKLDEIEVHRDIFRQSLTEQIEQPKNYLLIQRIDKWEKTSIRKIQQTAEEARQILIRNTNEYIHEIEMKLRKLTNQLRETREENDFNEITLHHFEKELKQLTKQLTKPSNISTEEDSTPFIRKISVNVSGLSTMKPTIHHNTAWIQNGFTVAGGNGLGNGLNQLSHPVGMYVDDDQTVYVADSKDHRIVKWKRGATDGQVVAGGNGKGDKMNQLSGPLDVIVDKERDHLIICDSNNRRVVRWPRQNGTNGQTIISNIDCYGLTMDNSGYLYVCDWQKDEVRRWTMNDTVGTLVAGGNGKGNDLNQLNTPTFIFVDEDHSVYVSDWCNHRVMKWIEGAKEGIVVAGGQGQGNGLTQLSHPQGLVVDQLGAVYVADCLNHRIMRWCKGATQGNFVVGGNGKGKQANQLYAPIALSFDRQGNLYVVDCDNDRMQRFDID